MKHVLEIDSVQLEFGVKKVLSDIYLKCETGKITGLLGRTGQGKSCLLNIMYGTLKTENRSVRFDTASLFHAYKKNNILTLLPQFNFIPGPFTVDRIFSDFNLDYSAFERYFPQTKAVYNSSFGTLSGGLRRLVEVYIIIKSGSLFSLLDEPFTHLMPLHIEIIKEILHEEKSKKGFLVTDHMYKDIIDVCDNIYLLSNGKLHLVKSLSEIESHGYANLSSI